MPSVPIKDTKDTGKFSKLVRESADPVTVTKNGYGEFVALRVEDYDGLRYRASMADLYAELLKSERDAAEGRVLSLADLKDEVGGRYGL